MIRPDRSLILICLEISSAASKLVSKAVLSTFFCFIERPELMSIDTNASVGLITKYPPEFNLTCVSKISFSLVSIFSLKKKRNFVSIFFYFF